MGGRRSLVPPFESFKNRAYRFYWAASMGQMGAMNMQLMSRSWFMLQLAKPEYGAPFGPGVMLGIMAMASAGPMLFLSLFGGVIADRVHKKDVLLVLPYPLQLNSGTLTSTGGTLTLAQGGTLGNSATLDVRGTTLELANSFAAEADSLQTDDATVLKLLDNTTLSFNGQKLFKALEHNSRTLTLGTADTHLELIDPLILSAMALHTQEGSLSLQGALTLDNGSLLDSTSGTLTLGGTADNLSRIALPGTTLVLQDDLSISGTLTTGAGTVFQHNGFALNLSGGTLELGGDLNLSGTVTDNATRLRLLTDVSLESQGTTSLGDLDLNGFADASSDEIFSQGLFGTPFQRGGLQLRGAQPGGDNDPSSGQRPATTVNDSDIEYFETVSEVYKDITGIEEVVINKAAAGAFFQYAYYHFGVPSFSTQGWALPRGDEDEDEGSGSGDARVLSGFDAAGEDVFVSWSTYQHPDLGEVEIGGFRPYVVTNPAPSTLPDLGAAHGEFIAHLSTMLPRVRIANTEVEAHGGGVFTVTAHVQNTGYFPSALQHGVRSRSVDPVSVQIQVEAEDILTGAAKTHMIQKLNGSGTTQTVSWVIQGRDDASVEIRVRAEKGGSDTATVTLR